MAPSHSTSTTSWALAFPNSHMVPLSISHTTQITQTTNIGPKTSSPLLLELGGSVGLSVSSYPKWVVCSLSSKAWESLRMLFKFFLYFKNTQVSETKEFRGSYYWATDSATGSRVLVVSVWCYRGNMVTPMWADVDSSESPHNHLSGILNEFILFCR